MVVKEVSKQNVHLLNKYSRLKWLVILRNILFLPSMKSGHVYEPTYSEYFYGNTDTQCNKNSNFLIILNIIYNSGGKLSRSAPHLCLRSIYHNIPSSVYRKGRDRTSHVCAP